MVEVSFYHLQNPPLEKSAAKLLEKAVEAKKRVVLLCDTEERLEHLNHFLWTYGSLAFLPHGSAKEGFEKDQPIWLTNTLENPNNASILMTVDGIRIEDFTGFDRCLDIFDGQDQVATKNARDRWKFYQQHQYKLSYWQQSEAGAWEKKS